MSSIVWVGDLHLGARSGSSHFVEYFNKFFTEVLYPYMKKNGIKTILQSGDMWDNRTQLNLKAYHASKPVWFDPLVENGWTMHTLIGNHDITLRESLSINSQTNLLQEYIESGAVKVYDKPSVLEIDGTTIDMIPWICKENSEEISKFMNRKKVSDLCFGHFEISGAEMYRGIPGHGGLSQDLFAKYEATLSGHYHTRSFLEGNRINYIGTPYEMTWMDAHDARGFTVFDTVTREFEFIRNPNTMFNRLHYNNGCTVDFKTLTGKFVKLIVEEKTDLFAFDSFLNNVKAADPYDLSIIENTVDVTGGDVDDKIDVEDTNTIISSYIDGLETNIDKDKIKSYVQSLFIEAANK